MWGRFDCKLGALIRSGNVFTGNVFTWPAGCSETKPYPGIDQQVRSRLTRGNIEDRK